MQVGGIGPTGPTYVSGNSPSGQPPIEKYRELVDEIRNITKAMAIMRNPDYSVLDDLIFNKLDALLKKQSDTPLTTPQFNFLSRLYGNYQAATKAYDPSRNKDGLISMMGQFDAAALCLEEKHKNISFEQITAYGSGTSYLYLMKAANAAENKERGNYLIGRAAHYLSEFIGMDTKTFTQDQQAQVKAIIKTKEGFREWPISDEKIHEIESVYKDFAKAFEA